MKFREEKGITLVALVITVIIMMILAGVAMNAISGPEGIFSKAREAADKYNNAVEEENAKLDELLNSIPKIPSKPEDPEKKKLILMYDVTAGEEISIECPVVNTEDIYNVTVDYGDGTTETIDTAKELKHKYINAGQYQVKIDGELAYFKVIDPQPLIEVINWGEIGVKRFEINTSKLLKIAKPNNTSFENMTSFIYSFKGCSGLTNIPEDLFANCPKSTNFVQTFYKCSGLTNIPENLFANCPNVVSFSNTFYECIGLTNIPEELFTNCINVTDFGSTFASCSGLNGSIPERLFANCSKVTSFNGTFGNCTGLNGNIPSELFTNCPNVTSFRSTFVGCSNLSGEAPALWNRTNVTDSKYCFYSCSKLSNLSSIPSTWK